MNLPFRDHHLLLLLDHYEQQPQLPLDVLMSQYYRANKAIGSKDRAVISEIAYSIVRWQGLLDYICEKPLTWQKRFALFEKCNLSQHTKREDIPTHIKVSFPQEIFDLIVESHGLEKGTELCRISNFAAPTTVRINSLKADRDSMLIKWKEAGYEVIPCGTSIHGIIFKKKINFFSLPEFREGLFEIQDEASQLAALRVEANPGELVMDYCAGSGGKTLAFAPRMQNKGQIFLHDIRPWALKESRIRLRRAGIQNAQIALPEDPKLSRLKKRMDWVLVDAPCSGTGTLRRNPDMKWKFDPETLVRLVGQQRLIFEKALSYLKPEGKIVYATCSILKEENEKQQEHFLKTYSLEVVDSPFITLPSEGGMDGFYCVTFQRKR